MTTWPPVVRLLAYCAAGVVFGVLATANGAGYRFGVSDQAFYIPVVLRSIDPALFPRDAALIDAQGHLMAMDEILGALASGTGVSLEGMYLAGYVLSVGLIWTAVVLIGARVHQNPWAVTALGAAVTLRHRIPETSANSLEPYFHPRMLAFGLGALAVAALLHERKWLAVVMVGLMAPVHITTALWFAVLIGVALAVLDIRMRRLATAGAAAAALLLAVAVAAGPLGGTLTTMDAIWLQAVGSKDSLFATGWPLWAWGANLGTLGLLWWMHQIRTAGGEATRADAALVWGATALVALFLVTLPLVGAGVALVAQFQIPRIFWLVDFVATVYLVAVLAGRPAAPRRAAVVATAFLALAIGRGLFVMTVERPERALVEVRMPASPWQDAMQWIRQQPRTIHVLADPGHAWKYDTSVRVAAQRDVFLEEMKDSALAIYSRDVALRVVERTEALGDFSTLSAERARVLAGRYDLDYLVTEATLPLPLLYRNDRFRIYALQ